MMRSAPHPAFKKTGTGGTKMARRYMSTSYYFKLISVALSRRGVGVTFEDVAIWKVLW
jgi:hypothetical protein